MAAHTITATVRRPFDETVEAARASLAEQGFGILTEIDIRATLKAKLDVDGPRQLILGACRPPLAHAALQLEPSIATLLPCNVVVRELDDATTLVEAMDPELMTGISGAGQELGAIAADAKARISAALSALTPTP